MGVTAMIDNHCYGPLHTCPRVRSACESPSLQEPEYPAECILLFITGATSACGTPKRIPDLESLVWGSSAPLS